MWERWDYGCQNMPDFERIQESMTNKLKTLSYLKTNCKRHRADKYTSQVGIQDRKLKYILYRHTYYYLDQYSREYETAVISELLEAR